MIEKNKNGHEKNKVKIINYEMDGYKIQKQHGIIQMKDNDIIYKNCINDYINNNNNYYELNIHSDWGYLDDISINTEFNIVNYKKKILYNKYITKLQLLENEYKDKLIINFNKTQTFKLLDIFDIEKNTELLLIKDIYNNNGNIPYISSSGNNNGIVGYVNKKTHDGNCITIAKNGTVGSCFYQEYDFTNSNDVVVLRLKEQFGILSMEIGEFICNILEPNLKKSYSYTRKLSIIRLQNIYISLPINENNDIDFEYIENL
jgi:hypothetical protein